MSVEVPVPRLVNHLVIRVWSLLTVPDFFMYLYHMMEKEFKYKEDGSIRLKKCFENAVSEMANEGIVFDSDSDLSISLLYHKMFKTYPNAITIETQSFIDGTDVKLKPVEYENRKSLYNIYKHMSELPECYVVVSNVMSTLLFVFDKMLFTATRNECYNRSLTCFTTGMEIPDWLSKYFVKGKRNTEYKQIEYLTYSSQACIFYGTNVDIKPPTSDIATNYNDDLPHNEIVNFLNSESSGLCILHGKPGTGKTTYFRHLIYSDIKDVNFIYIDYHQLSNATDGSFIDYLIEKKNSVIIFEDCEELLEKRENGKNTLINSLLNLSDGLLGDGLNLKFICTFNAPLTTIDDAILRKGRMKVMYEFNDLSPEKTQKLAKDIGVDIPQGESLPLCDIYNYMSKNDYTDKNNKKTIGF